MDDQTEARDQDQADVEEQQHRQSQVPPPGGAAARGPSVINPDEAFDPDGLVPPYEGRTTGGEDIGTGLAAEGANKAFDASHAGPPGPGRVESEEERSGVSGTDTTAASPLGVGVSTTSRGEDQGEDTKEGTKGESQRPHGDTAGPEDAGI